MMNVAIALSIVLCWLSHAEAQKAHEVHEVRDAKEAHIPHFNMQMPRAILHIGPQKTATTTVQTLMASAESIASMRGQNTYSVPEHLFSPERNGTILRQNEVIQFANDLHTLHSNEQSFRVAHMCGFFNESLSLGHNVILSTEVFVKLRLDKIRQLKDMLTGFNVTVIAVYREYISHLISLHNQVNKCFNGHVEPFSKYNMQMMDNTWRPSDYITLLGDWAEVFGKDALRIVDYYGSIAAGESVPHVVLCEAGMIDIQ
jgi:hypothetical protein